MSPVNQGHGVEQKEFIFGTGHAAEKLEVGKDTASRLNPDLRNEGRFIGFQGRQAGEFLVEFWLENKGQVNGFLFNNLLRIYAQKFAPITR